MADQKRLGVLGGGQLGKMLALAAADWHWPIHILDQSADFPAAPYATHFRKGNFKNFDDVYQFGKTVDVLTIEIEHVNTEALHQLQKEGLTIHPGPAQLDIIKDKGLQKEFYQKHTIPTAPFQLFADENALRIALRKGALKFPFVQKSRTAGYDGRGVAVIHKQDDLDKLIPGACLTEELVPFTKELSVIVARNEQGEIATYPLVEMEFNPEANLVELLLCPAQVSEEMVQKAEKIARNVIEAFDICGMLAVELFLNQDGEILVNEVAPRTHNSGHHTIESCFTSQFQQHLRAVLNFPLGSTRLKNPAVMLNLLGAEGHTGPAYYEGMEKCLAMEGVNIHLYGKQITKPFRKMGHVTIVGDSLTEARQKAEKVKSLLRVISQS
ncbi:MAG: N5-carboxyaminoimidazole ribonucleotide synthase [Saprospiraceae bacterium]|nr:MAG: N5-carboxyaminoimidazole ribonucleotide synthase [Saprospiraceae bacterium]